MKKKKYSLMQKLEFPEDSLPHSFHMEIFESGASVEGCTSVAEYADGAVRLNTHGAVISIIGSDLCVRSFVGNQTVVDGDIISVEFERRQA